MAADRRDTRTADTAEATNLGTYSREAIVAYYATRSDLQPSERVILDGPIGARLPESDVLDIGVGGGRTTGHLAPRARSYVGVDYSAGSVERSRARFPGVAFEHADARDLSRYADDAFDLVMFSFNGIDYVNHAGRLAALGEIRRVLRPGGSFVFSTHNREHTGFDRYPWQTGGLRAALGRRGREAILALPRHLWMNRMRVVTDSYAIVNDDAHRYTLMTYYIAPADQRVQLERAGFGAVTVYTVDGDVLEPGATDRRSVWNYYVAE